jgi:hypothetical protein
MDLTLAILSECKEFEDASLSACYEERQSSRSKAQRPSGEVKTAGLQRRIACRYQWYRRRNAPPISAVLTSSNPSHSPYQPLDFEQIGFAIGYASTSSCHTGWPKMLTPLASDAY